MTATCYALVGFLWGGMLRLKIQWHWKRKYLLKYIISKGWSFMNSNHAPKVKGQATAPPPPSTHRAFPTCQAFVKGEVLNVSWPDSRNRHLPGKYTKVHKGWPRPNIFSVVTLLHKSQYLSEYGWINLKPLKSSNFIALLTFFPYSCLAFIFSIALSFLTCLSFPPSSPSSWNPSPIHLSVTEECSII